MSALSRRTSTLYAYGADGGDNAAGREGRRRRSRGRCLQVLRSGRRLSAAPGCIGLSPSLTSAAAGKGGNTPGRRSAARVAPRWSRAGRALVAAGSAAGTSATTRLIEAGGGGGAGGGTGGGAGGDGGHGGANAPSGAATGGGAGALRRARRRREARSATSVRAYNGGFGGRLASRMAEAAAAPGSMAAAGVGGAATPA